MNCDLCGKKFKQGRYYPRKFDPETGESMYLCAGECTSIIMEKNKMLFYDNCDPKTKAKLFTG